MMNGTLHDTFLFSRKIVLINYQQFCKVVFDCLHTKILFHILAVYHALLTKINKNYQFKFDKVPYMYGLS